jgi:steroid delta-isomerase-like uncharacterized protein
MTKRDAFDAAIAAWNAGDLDTYLQLYADDIALYGYSEGPMPKSDVGAFYRSLFESLSDIVLEIHEVVESGDQLAARFTMHGTHTGEMAGIAPTGRRIQQPGMTILRFRDDQVVERHSVADFDTVIQQLTA